MKPLAVIRPGVTRGPWMLVVSDGGAPLFKSHDWARVIEVASIVIDTHTWDRIIDAALELS